jgi:hypothetical protein
MELQELQVMVMNIQKKYRKKPGKKKELVKPYAEFHWAQCR